MCTPLATHPERQQAMDSVGLPTKTEWQEGTPSDVEPTITPPKREHTPKITAN